MIISIDTAVRSLAAALALAAVPSPAQEPPPEGGQAAETRPASQAEVKALAEEVRRLKLELGMKDVEYASHAGMGPAASKVYFAPKGLSLGGYAELNYVNKLGEGGDESDLYRVVLYTGYRFDERIVFNAEVEFEHGDELAVEFAYLDFSFGERATVRVGNVLVPMGFVNLVHEPPFYNGVFRPEVERRIIPTTWNENGLGLYGGFGALKYQAYVLVGLHATNGELSPSSWIRNARTGGGQAPADDLAGVLALTYDAGPVTVGASFYRGKAGQGEEDGQGVIDATVTLAEAHAQLAWRGLTARALVTAGTLDDAARISALQDGDVIGSRVRGGYLDVGYDVLGRLAPDLGQALVPFVRVELLDLHDEVPVGLVPDPALSYAFLTTGLVYRPIPTVALKADYQRRSDDADQVSDQLNLGVGLVF